MKKTIGIGLISLWVLGFSPLKAAGFEGMVVCHMVVSSPNTQIDKPVNVFYKGSKVRMNLNLTGTDPSYTLADYSAKTMVLVFPKSKTYQNLGWSDDLKGGKPGETVVATGKTVKILGKTCTEWVYQGGDELTDIWATGGMGVGANFTPDSIWGSTLAGKELFILKGVTQLKQGSDTVITSSEATKIIPKTLKDSFFAVPADYQPKSN